MINDVYNHHIRKNTNNYHPILQEQLVMSTYVNHRTVLAMGPVNRRLRLPRTQRSVVLRWLHGLRWPNLDKNLNATENDSFLDN